MHESGRSRQGERPQALIVYYMVQRLRFPDERATLVWGAAAALIYVAPAVGGWIGDKVLGSRRTMLLGAVILGAGYALMVVPGQGAWFLFCALGVIVVGNGLFKANAGNLVRKIYEGDDSKIDSAFTIYYMAVKPGAMISLPLMKRLSEFPSPGKVDPRGCRRNADGRGGGMTDLARPIHRDPVGRESIIV